MRAGQGGAPCTRRRPPPGEPSPGERHPRTGAGGSRRGEGWDGDATAGKAWDGCDRAFRGAFRNRGRWTLGSEPESEPGTDAGRTQEGIIMDTGLRKLEGQAELLGVRWCFDGASERVTGQEAGSRPGRSPPHARSRHFDPDVSVTTFRSRRFVPDGDALLSEFTFDRLYATRSCASANSTKERDPCSVMPPPCPVERPFD